MTTDEARKLATDKIKEAIRAYSADPECMKPTSLIAREVMSGHAPGLATYLLDKLALPTPSSAGETVAREWVKDNVMHRDCFTRPVDEDRLTKSLMALLSRRSAPRVDIDPMQDKNYTLRLAHYWVNNGYPAQGRDVLRNALGAAGEEIGEKFSYDYAGQKPFDTPTLAPASVTDVGRAKDTDK